MYHPASLTPEVPIPASTSTQPDEDIASLKGENAALQSLFYGLCVALSQMGEVHREVVIQAFDYAHRAPMALGLRDAPDSGERGSRAFASALANMRDAILARTRF